MRCAESVRGEVAKALIVFLLAVLSASISFLAPSGTLAKLLRVENIPCLGLGVLSGALYVPWVVLAHRVCGRGHGVMVAVLTAAFLLLAGPWYGVTDPEWFGVYGLLSFFALGVLTELANGGFGGAACLVINWMALGIHKGVWPNPPVLATLALIATFLSGLAGDYAARFASRGLEQVKES